MILGWRGIVDRGGDVIAWPTVLMDHNRAFMALPATVSQDYRARWRQWDNEPGARIDFDPGASQEDIDKVQAWVDAAQGVTRPPACNVCGDTGARYTNRCGGGTTRCECQDA